MDYNGKIKAMVRKDETLRSGSIKLTTGEKRGNIRSTLVVDDGSGSKPIGSSDADVHKEELMRLSFANTRKIETWNVRSMNEGKLEIVKREMERVKVEALGISEMRWIGKGYFQSGKYRIYYSGHEELRKNGVAFIVGQDMANSVLGYNPVNDRILMMRLQGKPVNITLIQVYAPTAADEEEEHERFYSVLQEVIEAVSKGDVLIVMGDLNAKIGKDGESRAAGKWGLGQRNEAGNRLIMFCEGNDLKVMNTWFQLPERRLYTWTSPGGEYRNQIDYIMVGNRWASAIQAVNTLPGADCGTDHELLVAKLKVKLKKNKRTAVPKRYDTKLTEGYRVEIKNRFEALQLEEREPEELWSEAKEVVLTAAEKHLPKAKKTKSAPWLSEKAVNIAKERRIEKKKQNRDLEKIRELNSRFQAQARKDKEEYFHEACRQMETDNERGRTRDMFKKIKTITGKFVPRSGTYKTKKNGIATEAEECKARWMEYTEELYKKDENMKDVYVSGERQEEPDILESEVRRALHEINNDKAAGDDGIPIELWKGGDEEAIKVLTALCQRVWKTGVWPNDWKTSIYIPIHKKGDMMECSNYRTIALISHASKVMLKVIMRRMESFAEREMPDVQAGYRKSRGTRDHIANLRWIIERAREYNQDYFFCFIDYSKAFDSVDHDRMWITLRDMGFPSHLVDLLKGLYDNQTAKVRTDYGDTECFGIGKGVRQGCILSPCLFNLYAERIMREAGLDDTEEGIHVGGRIINNLRYADDSTLAATEEEELKNMLRRTKEASEKGGLSLNLLKTKVMTSASISKFEVDGVNIEIVKNFIFLGSNIREDGDCRDEIVRRLALGRSALTGMNRIWKDKDVKTRTKRKLVETLVFPIVMYGSESWTMRKRERERIDAFENWCWRRILRISWMAKRTNASVWKEVGLETTTLLNKINKQKLTYFGHVMRGNSLEKSIMIGMGEGKRGRGRPNRRWMDDIRELTGRTLQDLKEDVQDRAKWRRMVQGVTRGRERPDGT
jgi:exonuclease III